MQHSAGQRRFGENAHKPFWPAGKSLARSTKAFRPDILCSAREKINKNGHIGVNTTDKGSDELMKRSQHMCVSVSERERCREVSERCKKTLDNLAKKSCDAFAGC